MYILLIVILLILAFFLYKKFDCDILSPSVISTLMFCFCILLAWLGTISWNDEKISALTCLIIFSGLISFSLGEYFSRKSTKNTQLEKKYKHKIIEIEKYKVILSIIGVSVTICLIILEVKRICNYYDFDSNNLGELLNFYRTKIGLFSTDLVKDKVEMNFIVKQFKKICDVLCVIYMYIVINNIFAKDKIKRLVFYSIPIFLCLFVTLLSSGRSTMMHMIVSFVMIAFMIYRKKNNGTNNISKKIIIYSGIAVFSALAVFCIVLPIVGRSISTNIFDYLTFYIGTSIPSFNRFISNMPVHGSYIGNETFSGVYYVLNKLNIIDYLKAGTLGWTYFGSHASNVYTSFRRYYFDFGYIGVILCQFVFGFLISKLYLKVKNIDNKYLFIIYTFFAYILIDQIRDEQFFTLISSATLAYILLIIFFVWFVFEFDIKNSIKYLKKVHISDIKNIKKNKKR